MMKQVGKYAIIDMTTSVAVGWTSNYASEKLRDMGLSSEEIFMVHLVASLSVMGYSKYKTNKVNINASDKETFEIITDGSHLESGKLNPLGKIEGVREAGGLRQSALKELNSDEIKYIKSEFSEIGGDPDKLRFNKGSSTLYRDDIDAINIRGDIFPDLNEIHPRSVMSERAVLSHEYYGHAANRGTTAIIGSWNDEFRASYMVAKNAPNLSEIDRYHLIQGAISRAQEAGVSIRPNEFMRRILYGY